MASIHLSLPETLQSRLTAVAQRVRLLRAVRGVSLVLLVLALTAGVALLADHFLGLPAFVRQIDFLVWVGLGTLTLVTALVLPLCRRLTPAELAAVIEEKYPELGE